MSVTRRLVDAEREEQLGQLRDEELGRVRQSWTRREAAPDRVIAQRAEARAAEQVRDRREVRVVAAAPPVVVPPACTRGSVF